MFPSQRNKNDPISLQLLRQTYTLACPSIEACMGSLGFIPNTFILWFSNIQLDTEPGDANYLWTSRRIIFRCHLTSLQMGKVN